MISFTEENYLKAIFHLSEAKNGEAVTTNELAESTQTKAASVTDMLRKLAEKNLIFYKKYQGVTLAEEGHLIALKIIRKHRLWEVFLVEKLGFKWDEIHEIAEQLEHIESAELTERLATFLGNPAFDPHGDPIPDANGTMPALATFRLSEVQPNKEVKLRSVAEDSSAFLQHLDRLNLYIGSLIQVLQKSDFDQSLTIQLNNQETIHISAEVAQNLLVVTK